MDSQAWIYRKDVNIEVQTTSVATRNAEMLVLKSKDVNIEVQTTSVVPRNVGVKK